MRELLRQSAAPGDAKNVHLFVAKLEAQLMNGLSEARHPVRPSGIGRTTDARYVEADHPDALVQRVDQRLERLQACANTVAHQKWRYGGITRTYLYADVLPANVLNLCLCFGH